MLQAEASENKAGSIDAVVSRLLRWGRIAPSGLARVEYISDTSQQTAVLQLCDGLRQAGIPCVEIALPARKSAVEQVRFLKAQLAKIETGVVCITGFARAFSEDTPLLESLRVFNFNRENLADFPLRQIWWMPRDFTQTFRQSIPDLNSWFIIKLRLDEITPPLDVAPRPEESLRTHPMSHEEGIKTSNFYASRFRTALQRHENVETLWQLWIDAVKPLLDIGGTNEAIQFQNALLQEASENGVLLHNYLAAEQPDPNLVNRIGRVYAKERLFTDAESLYKKALAIRHNTLPKGHLDIAISLNALARLYSTQGRYPEAERLYQEALTIRRTALPEGHESIATTLNNLAFLYETQGRYSEAESLYQEAVGMLMLRLGREHPTTRTVAENYVSLLTNHFTGGDSGALPREP